VVAICAKKRKRCGLLLFPNSATRTTFESDDVTLAAKGQGKSN
jgi:hypothetical protein